MTRTLARIGRPLQLAGLAAAVAGLVLALLSGSGTNMSIGGPAVVVVLLDLYAVTARRGSISIGAAVLGAIVAFLIPLVLTFGGRPVGIVRAIDPNVAYTVLAWSAVPSVVGAVLRRLAR